MGSKTLLGERGIDRVKTKFNKYNDGVVSVYREKERKTDFNANMNVSTLEDMEFVAKFDFEEASRREQDIEFAEQMGFSLSLKIRTRLFDKVDNKCKAVINGYLYDISYVDKNRQEMWLYMEGIKNIATQ